MNFKNLDHYIEGTFDPNAPFNQSDSEPAKSISDIIDDFISVAENDENGELDLIPGLLSEVRKEVQQLRELCKQTNKNGNKDFLINRLTKIYNKL